MNTPCRHPSHAALLSYAAGTLDAASNFVLEQHLAQCPECERIVALGEQLAGLLLARMTDEEGAAGNPDVALRRGEAPDPAPRPALAEADLPLQRLRRATFARGVGFRPLWREGRHRLVLMRIEPGQAIPPHKHRGLELMMPLSGGFSDGHGAFQPGDLLEVEAGDHHRIQTVGDAPCVCLVAITGPPRWRSWAERARQLVFGL